jgi:predicted dehydrogenase
MIERALVAGLGSIGKRHLHLLRERLPNSKIMVLRHGNCDEFLAEANACTTSLDEALNFEPQIAIVATPAPFHAAPTIALASRGVHVLVEKPMAADAAAARAMAEAAATAGVVLQVGYNLRFLESLAAFRKAILEARIGRVASVRAEVGQYLPNWRPGRDWRDSVSARAELGGGVLLELSHELDLLRWVFGEVLTVRACMGRQGALGIDVEDTVHAVLGFANQIPQGSFGVAPMASVTLDFMRRDTVRRCVAIGETGTLIWDGIAKEVGLAGSDGEYTVIQKDEPGRNESYIAQLNSFLAAVQSGTDVAVDAVDGVAVMDIVEAVRRSHEAGGLETLTGFGGCEAMW